ncbi:RNase P/MRP, p29 subunit [Neocallimastix lanati (nom. inval.)]|uniref:Ribonuclease P protein subunit n=1 Tax=Neocallimastix californiae TaxID=1754190 RepID=A0A1Y2D443_9FUNG|nr:RNase P/MRP, p29 subunit [Neocallimastix sp. JGI-2020a]ORY54068.1 RNase P/MRP, p29 subunit [Neocallimastix californiae]|eukprot:ORY54068.1 RNase P/MRP, p29 subunit [Neocallimastix californiae]
MDMDVDKKNTKKAKGITEKGLYAKLPENIKQDAKKYYTTATETSSTTNTNENNNQFLPGFIKTILTTPTTYSNSSATISFNYNDQQASQVYDTKIEKRKQVPLENFPLSDQQKEEKTKEKKIRKLLKRAGKKNLMSRRERKKSGMWEIPMEARKYELYKPLHQLWTQYMKELLGDNIPTNNYSVIYSKLLKADFHGSVITVVQSKCPSYIGKSGILLKETENTFNIITKNDRLLIIPKAHSVFTIHYDKFLFKIYGDNFKFNNNNNNNNNNNKYI